MLNAGYNVAAWPGKLINHATILKAGSHQQGSGGGFPNRANRLGYTPFR
jgi:hypothetical protein